MSFIIGVIVAIVVLRTAINIFEAVALACIEKEHSQRNKK